ncbi:MAG: hypothetical protein HWE22_04950 [Flavobacteriales bacterium]|nr:hypothetical protein [Flavobacteriales bacterium]
MNILDRGFIIVRPKQAFVDWANQQDDEFQIDLDAEPSVYLIEEDFFEVEPIIERHYKMIFECELVAVSDNEEGFPEIKMDVFKEWFSLEVGSTVVDLEE